MTYETVENDRKRLIKHCRNNPTNITINLENVVQFDSAGLALLVEAKRICIQLNIICNIKNHPQTVQDLATFYNVNNII